MIYNGNGMVNKKSVQIVHHILYLQIINITRMLTYIGILMTSL